MLKPVYDILNCGPRRRFGANGKLVHNSNYQNLRRGGELRQSLRPPEGYKLVKVDAGQIECRGVNHLAGQWSILEMFAQKRDVYCELATRIYGRTITKADEGERWLGKTVELGSGFGLGWRMLCYKLNHGQLGGMVLPTTESEAQHYINVYRESHPKVKELWRFAGDVVLPALAAGREMPWGPTLVKDHRLYLPNGSFLDYTGLYWGFYGSVAEPGEEPQWWHPGPRGKKRYHGPKLVENVVQALWSGLFIREKMIVVARRWKIVLQVHDEIVALVPDAAVAEAERVMMEAMTTPPAWARDIPLASEVKVLERYQ